MAELENLTPYRACHVPATSLEDRQLSVLVVAATFELPPAGSSGSGELRLAEEQAEVPLADEYWGASGESSLRREGQSTHIRLGTDVYLSGSAWAPGGRPTARSSIGLEIDGVRRGAVVFGDRHWSQGLRLSPSSPRPFSSIPLVYERCFGGSPNSPSRSVALAALHNPVGVGLYAGEREATNQPLPNFEDPAALIGSVSDRPRPVGFGPVARHWLPRREYGGTYDDAWIEVRAPLWPKDIDPRFFSGGAPGLCGLGALGGAAVHITGLHPDGGFSFRLPSLKLQAKFDLRKSRPTRQLLLDAVHLETDEGRVVLFFRTTFDVEPDPLQLQRITLRESMPWERCA